MQKNNNDDDIVLIVPSDHLINDIAAFAETVRKGEKLAQAGYIVTFGIKPTYPETGYGYIKTAQSFETGFEVEKFVEKPDLVTAQEYLNSGKFYWNAGIFMAKISTLLDEFAKYEKQIRQAMIEGRIQ